MFIDKQGRLFGKISIVDLLIILAIVATLGFIGYKYSTAMIATPFSKADDIEVVIYCNEMPDFSAKTLKTGEEVKDIVKGNEFGTSVDIKIGKSDSEAMTDKGEFIVASKPNYSSVYVTVDGKGMFGSNGVTIGNSEYYVGNTVTFKVGNTALYGKIYSIEKKG